MRRIYILLLFFLYCYTSHSQSISPYVVSTKGEYFNNASSSLSWTLGQIASKSYFSVDNILTQGFQQPYYYDPSNIPEQRKGVADIDIYPNPARDLINIIYSTEVRTSLRFEMLDLLGNKLKPDIIKKSDSIPQKIVINIHDLKSGVYIIRILAVNTNYIKTYKIIKME